jgi:hypothetical protein
MRQMFDGLQTGLLLAVAIIFLLLMANFESVKLAVIVVATVPAVIAGVALALWLTHTTLNIQSFMGAIMAIGVAVANAILLVTFAERSRIGGATSADAAAEGAQPVARILDQFGHDCRHDSDGVRFGGRGRASGAAGPGRRRGTRRSHDYDLDCFAAGLCHSAGPRQHAFCLAGSG